MCGLGDCLMLLGDSGVGFLMNIFWYKFSYRALSSVVEQSTADRQVTGSIPVGPFLFYVQNKFKIGIKNKTLTIYLIEEEKLRNKN